MTAVEYPPQIVDIVAQMRNETEFIREMLVPMAEVGDSRIKTVHWTVGNWSEFVELARKVTRALLAEPWRDIAVAMPNKEFAEAFIEPFFAVACAIEPQMKRCAFVKNTDRVRFEFSPNDLRGVQVFSRQAAPLPGVCANTMFVVLGDSVAQEAPAAPGVTREARAAPGA